MISLYLVQVFEHHKINSLLRVFHTLRKKFPYSELFWSAFFPHFPAFGLNTETYEVSLRIQSECGKIRGKMRTRITLNTDTFYAVTVFFQRILNALFPYNFRRYIAIYFHKQTNFLSLSFAKAATLQNGEMCALIMEKSGDFCLKHHDAIHFFFFFFFLFYLFKVD